MKIIVLGGGISVEREVSLRSSQAVAEALRAAGYEVERIDPQEYPDFGPDAAQGSIVFPILHGAAGEDGVIQRYLESFGLPYLGSTPEVSERCFDKWILLQKLRAAGIPTAAGDAITAGQYAGHPLARSPHVLKSNHGGSSIGTYIVHDPQSIDQAKVDDVFARDDHAIIEELVTGTEITIPILDSTVLPVIEIHPPGLGDFDYENKYNGMTEEICPPRSIDAATQAAAQSVAEKTHQLSGARHLSRVDLIVRDDGSMAVLEINTMPGMTDRSLFPKSAAVYGLSMPDLMGRFVSMVRRDYGLNE